MVDEDEKKKHKQRKSGKYSKLQVWDFLVVVKSENGAEW